MIVSDLWASSFNKTVIQKDLRLNPVQWEKNKQKLSEFLKSYKIKNELVTNLNNELKFMKQLSSFKKRDALKVKVSYENKLESGERFVLKDFCLKSKKSFLAVADSRPEGLCLVEDAEVISHGVLVNFGETDSSPDFALSTSSDDGDYDPDVDVDYDLNYSIENMVYSSKEDAYFFTAKSCLYRKDSSRRRPRRVFSGIGYPA